MEITTTDMAKFGFRELKLAGELLSAYKTEKDRCKVFENNEVQVMMNMNSGYVFLTNSEYQVAMLNSDGFLEDFLSCPECRFEGFIDDFSESEEECCKNYIKSLE